MRPWDYQGNQDDVKSLFLNFRDHLGSCSRCIHIVPNVATTSKSRRRAGTRLPKDSWWIGMTAGCR